MSTVTALQLPARGPGLGLAICWTLSSERAVMLGAPSDGYLQVNHGTVWATFDGPHHGPANDWGDLILRAGTGVHVSAGQHVVIERFRPAANEAVSFSWQPVAARPARPKPRIAVMLEQLAARVVHAWSSLGRGAGVSGQWMAPGPARPNEPASEYGHARDLVWRELYHLRTNPP